MHVESPAQTWEQGIAPVSPCRHMDSGRGTDQKNGFWKHRNSSLTICRRRGWIERQRDTGIPPLATAVQPPLSCRKHRKGHAAVPFPTENTQVSSASHNKKVQSDPSWHGSFEAAAEQHWLSCSTCKMGPVFAGIVESVAEQHPPS